MSEIAVREKARQDYKAEGCCNNKREYPVGSQFRLWYLDEAHKIMFENEWSAIN